MNVGKTLFAQLMEFLLWKTFHRIVDRYDGDRYVKSMTCADQFRVMTFAQLTYRKSLRDIEVCLSAQSAKLYHMGLRQETKHSTLPLQQVFAGSEYIPIVGASCNQMNLFTF